MVLACFIFHFFFVNLDYNLIYFADEIGLFFLQSSTSLVPVNRLRYLSTKPPVCCLQPVVNLYFFLLMSPYKTGLITPSSKHV